MTEVSDKLLLGHQHQVGSHSPHLASKQFVVAHHHRSGKKVLRFVRTNKDPGWLLSRQDPSDHEAVDRMVLPIESAHGHDVAVSLSKGLNRRFKMGQLLHSHVSETPMGVDGALNLVTNAVVTVGGGEDDKSLLFIHPFTSAEVSPHGLWAWTIG